MQLTRALELFVLGLSAMSVAEAAFVEVNVIGRDGVEVQRRQTDDAANTSTPSSSSSPAQTSSTPPASSSSSSNPAPASTSSHTQAPATSSTPTNSPSTSTPPPKTSTPSSSSVTVASSTADNNAQSSSSKPADSGSSAQPTTMTSVLTITTTAPDGRQMTLTSSMVTTATPGLADSANNSGSSSGMSTQTRNTVIGVVVGVGGAIILAGLALVAWRIWGRRKHAEENDGLMDYPLSGTAEKLPDSAGGGTGSGSMAGRTPFQSTLESYHAPTQVNTAANF